MRAPWWPRSARAGAERESTPVRLAALAGDRDVDLVLGLEWHTILGADLRRQALRRARARQATHIVHAGGRSESVGTVRLVSRGRTQARRQAHAAAQLFATQSGDGAHALIWRLDPARIWVVQARDGRVLGGGDLVADPAQASAAVQAFQQRFGTQARLWGDLDAVSPQAPTPAPSLQALAAGCGPGSLLQPRPRAWRVLALVPLLLAVPALAWQAQHPGAHPSAVPLPDDVALTPVPDLHTQQRLALEQTLARLVGPSVSGLAAAWQAIGELPLRPAGWRLHAVRCRMADGGWACEADYARGQASATAASLDAQGLPGTLHWQGLDQATSRFVIPAPMRALRAQDLSAQAPGLIADADALQGLRPAFAQVRVGAAVNVPAPPGADGQAGPVVLRQREVRLRGPLRSLTLIDEVLTQRIVWHTLHVSFEPGARASVDASVVVADLQGMSYEPAS